MLAAFSSMHESYSAALAGMSVADAQTHPEGDVNQWCARELIEHLLLTYRGTSSVLEERLQKGRPTQAPVTPEHQALWRATIMKGHFPEGGKAPDRVRPGQLQLPALCGDDLAALLKSDMDRMDGLLDQCEEKFGGEPMASHFRFGPLSAHQWREFHTVHGRHHLSQMMRIRANILKGLLSEK
jgi:hypothetical protein